MSERITGAELLEMKLLAARGMIGQANHEKVAAAALLLGGEVRRFRGLIAEISGLFVGGPGPCIVCYATLPDHKEDCAGAAIEAEARAIREERGPAA